MSDPLSEPQREIYDYIKEYLNGLTYQDAKEILEQLLWNLGKTSIVTDKPNTRK